MKTPEYTKIFFLCLLLTVLALPTQAELLFKASFDSYQAAADLSKGPGKSREFDKLNLQMRMFPGMHNKGNALQLNKEEECNFPMGRNMDVSQGTLSLWVQTFGWHAGSKDRVSFFALMLSGFHCEVVKEETCPYRLTAVLHSDAYPGKQKIFYVFAGLDPETWIKDSWHNLTFTWSNEGMKMYIDGVLGKNEFIGTSKVRMPSIKFPEGTNFGSLNKNREYGTIRLGYSKNTAASTFDNLEIFDNVLSADEIRDRVFKLNPPREKKLEPASVSAPAKGSSRVVLLNPVNRAIPVPETPTYVNLSQDGKSLKASFALALPPAKATYGNRDENIWEDDSFEIQLLAPNGKDKYQFIVNSKGAIYDSKNEGKQWNGNPTAKVTVTDRGWKCDVTLPFADMGMKAGEKWLANFGVCLPDGQRRIACWSGQNFAPNGKLTIGGSGFAVQDWSSAANGTLKVTGNDNGTVMVTSENGTTTNFAMNKDIKLDSGSNFITVKSTDGEYRLNTKVLVRRSLELQFVVNPVAKTLLAQIDYTDTANAHAGTVDFCGQSRKYTTEKGRGEVTFNLPEAVGNYSLVVKDDGGAVVEGSINVPDRKRIDSDAGRERVVLKPWIPVKVEGSTVSVLNRSYTFGNSPFPTKIISGGNSLLTRDFALELNGKLPTWSDFKIDSHDSFSAKLSGKGKFQDGTTIAWSGEVFFDGLYLLDWKLIATADGLNIHSLKLNYAVVPEHGKTLLYYDYTGGIAHWKDGKAEIAFNEKQPCFVWSVGDVYGLYLGFNALANWVPGNSKEITATRNGNATEICANIIQKDSMLKGEAKYQWSIMATPGRPYVPRREKLSATMAHLKGKNYMEVICWTTSYDYRHWEDQVCLAANEPEDPVAFGKGIDEMVAKGRVTEPLVYSMAGYLASRWPEYDFIKDYCKVTPDTHFHSYVKYGEKRWNMSICQDTLAANIAIHNLEQLYIRYPKLKGIYYDIGHPRTCGNTMHGHGGRDAFGRIFRNSCELPMRQFYYRSMVLGQRYGKVTMVHVPASEFSPVTHNFADFISPGEEFVWGVASNIKRFYVDIDPQVMQVEYNNQIHGMEVFLLPQIGRAAATFPNLGYKEKELYKDNSYFRSVMSVLLVHGINVWFDWLPNGEGLRIWAFLEKLDREHGTFHGYWTGRPEGGYAPPLRISTYDCGPASPWKKVWVIANPGKSDLTVPASTFDKADKYYNAWEEGREMSQEEMANLQVKANDFVIIAR